MQDHLPRQFVASQRATHVSCKDRQIFLVSWFPGFTYGECRRNYMEQMSVHSVDMLNALLSVSLQGDHRSAFEKVSVAWTPRG